MNLNAALRCSVRVQTEALPVLVSPSVPLGCRPLFTGEEAAGPTVGFSFSFFFFFNSTWLFGSRRGVQRGTNDAMSRRKLGSRPQHLSAIQGKPEGRQRHVGTLELFEGSCERVVLCVTRKYTHRSALSHRRCAQYVDARWHMQPNSKLRVSFKKKRKIRSICVHTGPQIPAWMCSFNSLCRL